MFLAEDEAKFWVIMIWLLVFGLEDDHNTILEEIIELQWIGIETLRIQVMDSGAGVNLEYDGIREWTHSFSGRST